MNQLVAAWIGLSITLVVFLLCRELVCWYFKINKMYKQQEEIIKLLNRIVDNTSQFKKEENS